MDGWRRIKRIYFKSRSFWPIGFLTLRYNHIKVCQIQFVFTIHRRVESKLKNCWNVECSLIMVEKSKNKNKIYVMIASLFCTIVFFYSKKCEYSIFIWVSFSPCGDFFCAVFMFAYDLFCLQWLNMNSVSILIQYYITQVDNFQMMYFFSRFNNKLSLS